MTEKKKRASGSLKEKVADAGEITEFWTAVMRDDETELKDKLKVSELLAKAQGVFTETKNDEDERSGVISDMTLEEKLEFMEEYVREYNRRKL